MTLTPKAKKLLYYSFLVVLAFGIGYVSFRLSRSYEQSTSRNEPLALRHSDSRAYPALFDNDAKSSEGFSDSSLHSEEYSIPDELVVSFPSDTKLQLFLHNAGNEAIRIIGHNRTLRSVRIRKGGGAARIAESLGGSVENNYTLLSPLPVAPSVTTSNTAFEDSALKFLRVPIANENAGSGIKVAILDSGIREHTTFSDTQISEFDFVGGSTSSEYASHGTAVASLIGGKNGNGIAPGAELISIRVLDSDGIGDTFSLAEGIVKAVEEGAQIVNLSVASYGSNSALQTAVDFALENEVVLVAAAGNESLASLPYPAAYEGVISVSAIDALGYPTEFANQSESIDVAAPGVGVYAAWDEEDWVSFTGTSAAAPYVSGAIAYLASSLPNTSPTEAAELLLSNASDTGLPGADFQTGSGYIDIQRSLDASTSYSDVALSSIYLSPDRNADGSQTLSFSAQNRGTEAVDETHLEITLDNGITQSIYLGPLSPSEVTSYQLDVTQSQLNADSGFPVSARIVSGSSSDRYPENDSKQVTLLPSP